MCKCSCRAHPDTWAVCLSAIRDYEVALDEQIRLVSLRFSTPNTKRKKRKKKRKEKGR